MEPPFQDGVGKQSFRLVSLENKATFSAFCLELNSNPSGSLPGREASSYLWFPARNKTLEIK